MEIPENFCEKLGELRENQPTLRKFRELRITSATEEKSSLNQKQFDSLSRKHKELSEFLWEVISSNMRKIRRNSEKSSIRNLYREVLTFFCGNINTFQSGEDFPKGVAWIE